MIYVNDTAPTGLQGGHNGIQSTNNFCHITEYSESESELEGTHKGPSCLTLTESGCQSHNFFIIFTMLQPTGLII